MKIRLIDAVDAFGMGGVIDLQTGKYIAPKWFSDAHPANNTGLSEEDYKALEENPSRYMRTPVFRVTGVYAFTAMQMGMTREDLVRCGMSKNEYWNFFQPRKDNPVDAFHYRWSDEEWNISKAINKWMWDCDLYNSYDANIHVNIHNIIRTWFHARGLEIEDE